MSATITVKPNWTPREAWTGASTERGFLVARPTDGEIDEYFRPGFGAGMWGPWCIMPGNGKVYPTKQKAVAAAFCIQRRHGQQCQAVPLVVGWK